MSGAPEARWVIAGTVGVLVGLRALGGDPLAASLRLEPDAFVKAPWTLLTAHWVHLTLNHAALNAATFAVFALLLPKLRQLSWLALLVLVCSLTVDLGVLLRHEVAWYVGFSGVLYGTMTGAAAIEALRRDRLSGLILVGLFVKFGFDQAWGTPATTVAFVGGRVLSEAHIYGASGGLLAAVGAWALRTRGVGGVQPSASSRPDSGRRRQGGTTAGGRRPPTVDDDDG